ncbi:hypothetical protein RSOL_283110, partial [Rhizoctonia solani AG-3 Rhs1AP]
MGRGPTTVDLAWENPFAEASPRSRSGGQSGGHFSSRQPVAQSSRRYQPDEDEEYARSTNVTQLPNVNPFGLKEPTHGSSWGGRSGARQSVRRQARVRSDDGADGGIINLPHVNPFASGGNRDPASSGLPIHWTNLSLKKTISRKKKKSLYPHRHLVAHRLWATHDRLFAREISIALNPVNAEGWPI